MVRGVTSMIVAMAILVAACFASCPANGNTHVLYVTTNMGTNIDSFDTNGRNLGPVIDTATFPPNYRVDKLRAMVHGPDGNLYISSARGPYSKIFAVSGNGVINKTLNSYCTRSFLYEVVALGPTNPYMDHPYGMLFHPEDGSIIVSNQNSITVTRYVMEKAHGKPTSWKPAPVGRALRSGILPDTPAPIPNSGLLISSNSALYTLNSVRGIALSPLLPRRVVEGAEYSNNVTDGTESARFYLVVCDVISNALLVFNAAGGEYLFSLAVRSPIQVAFPHESFRSGAGGAASTSTNPLFVYVTSKDNGLLYKVPFRVGGDRDLLELNKPQEGKSLSGLFENPGHGIMYVGDRTSRKIAMYTTPHVVGTKKTAAGHTETVEETEFVGHFQIDLPDQPEFLLLTRVELQRNLPSCYELTPSGELHYTALCTAVHLWLAVGVIGALVAVALALRKCITNQLLGDLETKRRRIYLFHAMEDELEK